MTFPYLWYWKKWLPERKSQPCRVIVRGKMNSALVEFPDGYRVVTSRWAIRKKDHAMKEPQKMWAVFNRRGRMVMTRAGGTEHDTLRHYGDSIGVSKKILVDQGYTCREVEVKEVDP